MDQGDVWHVVCVLDGLGEIYKECKIRNTREAISEFLEAYPDSVVAIEAGMHSPWISRLIDESGCRAIVANPRKLRAIFQNDRKSDELDARMLAKLARADESLLYPIEHGSERAQRDLIRVKLRDNLVRQRIDVISAVRFSLKSLGISSDWVDQRTERTASKASDISHIESIRERYERSLARSQVKGPSDGSETAAEDSGTDPKRP